MGFRTKIIQLLIEVNEKIFFYPALKKFYSAKLKQKHISIIDVGSNKGQSIDFFLSIHKQGQVFGFEPNKKLFQKLCIKYRKNPRIHLYNTGISSRTGTLVFNENMLDETSSFEELNFDSAYLEKKAKVLGVNKEKLIVDSYEAAVTTLDMFLNENPDLYVDVLKIDVEGHELQSLKGLFTGKNKNYPVRFIQLESHADDMYLNVSPVAIENLLKENGFEEIVKFKHGFGNFYEIIYENKRSA